MINDMNHGNIADYIIKTVQEDSTLSGHQLIIYFEELEDNFGIIPSDDLDSIYDELMRREEICDVIMEDDAFDVNLYTDFAPNYDDEWDLQ